MPADKKHEREHDPTMPDREVDDAVKHGYRAPSVIMARAGLFDVGADEEGVVADIDLVPGSQAHPRTSVHSGVWRPSSSMRTS